MKKNLDKIEKLLSEAAALAASLEAVAPSVEILKARIAHALQSHAAINLETSNSQPPAK